MEKIILTRSEQPDLDAEFFHQVIEPQLLPGQEVVWVDEVVATPEASVEQTPHQQAVELKARIGELSPRDQDFAGSLLNQLERKGDLSSKQWFWIGKLAEKLSGAAQAAPQQGEKLTDAAGAAKIVELFNNAKGKRPRIVFDLAGQQVVFGMMKGGAIKITDGGPFGSDTWFGKITPEGEFIPGAKSTDTIRELVKAFAEDPLGVATAHGKKTGHCCLCNRSLTDPKSVDLGIGPVCKARWGL